MAVRDFTDSAGIEWRVWPVTPDQIQPRTAVEDYLGDYGEGWLCFESASERRRLASFPADWADMDDAGLEELLARASVVGARRQVQAEEAGESESAPG